jgi:hypothetical protein
MNARLVRVVAAAACAAGFVVLAATAADVLHLLHATLLLTLGAGALLTRPRTG